MRVRDEIKTAIASLCEDIRTHYQAEENKARADAVSVLVAALNVALWLPDEERRDENDTSGA